MGQYTSRLSAPCHARDALWALLMLVLTSAPVALAGDAPVAGQSSTYPGEPAVGADPSTAHEPSVEQEPSSEQDASAGERSSTDEQASAEPETSRGDKVAEILQRAGATEAPEEETEDDDDREERRRKQVADILARVSTEASDIEYPEPRNCINARRYEKVQVLNEHYVAFVGRRTVWVNELRRRCHGLRDDDTISFEVRGNRMCSLSRFETFDMFFGQQFPIATCFLGKFHEVTPEQLTVLETAMD